ncbi:MAG: T9SS type A sorting domain-containing protein [Ignavibacteria bacterium]
MKKIYVLLLIFLIFTSELSAQWIPVGQTSGLGGDIMSLLEYNGVLYAGGTAYLFRSSDEGVNWSGYLGPIAYAWSLVQSNGNIFCGLAYTAQTPGVYISTNNGLNWSITSLLNISIDAMTGSGSQVLASSMGQGKIYSTTNNGLNWTTITTGLSGHLAISGNRIYCAGSGLRVTTNNGASWNIIHNSGGISVVADDSLVIFGTQDGDIYRSTNYGQTWTKTYSVSQAYVYSLYKYGSYIFAGTDSGFVVSTDGGLSFFNRNQNLGASRITAIMVYNNYVYVANGNYAAVPVAVWRRQLADVIGIKSISSQVPSAYKLFQNYPNPFNPTTVFRFDLPVSSHTKLIIYDVIGREIKTLVNDKLNPGTYEVQWDGSGYSSGVYFYRLVTEGYQESKKMILNK